MSLPDRCCGNCRWCAKGVCHAAIPQWAYAAIMAASDGHQPNMVTPYYGTECKVFERKAVEIEAKLG